MAYTPEYFQYTFRSFDIDDLSEKTADILDVKDKQIEWFLKNELNKIQTETGNLLSREDIRFGTSVVTLPVVNGYVQIGYAIPFASTFTAFSVVVSNGDYTANTARLEVANADRLGFQCYHGRADATGTVPTGTAGNLVRVNYSAFAWS